MCLTFNTFLLSYIAYFRYLGLTCYMITYFKPKFQILCAYHVFIIINNENYILFEKLSTCHDQHDVIRTTRMQIDNKF